MSFQIRPDVEPIPGYRLVERLGTGGYGEVWKATAPGGLTKAIKIVFGHIGDDRTEQELKALDRIRKVRHPFLLSLERFEIVDGQLCIITELADMSLMDRFDACKKAGMQGVPREELLGYLLDAADALDYIQKNYGLQHLDIKPQNLLIVGGRIKIADFGLVKDLQGTSVTATGGVTPVYATPEAFDGRVSRFSDQYSLAIVYQEMLTSFRPFPGTTALQLAAQHTSSPPLLTPLPVHDRSVLARALAKIPEQRFPTCREMVESLTRATTAVQPQAPAPRAKPAAAADKLSSPSLAEMGSAISELKTNVGLQAQVDASATPTKKGAVTPKPAPQPPPSLEELEAFLPSSEACLRPTLVVGIWGLAGRVLRRWKQRLVWRFGAIEDVPAFRLLQIDTDRRALAQLQESAGVFLKPEETLFLPLHDYMHYRKYKDDWLRWIHRQSLGDIPKSLTTEGKRPIGRLAFVDNAGGALDKLGEAVAAVTNPIARMRTAKAAGLIYRDESPQVFVVAAITGGTGGGILIDVAYALRQLLKERQIEPAAVSALLMYTTGQRPSERELALGNAYATLTELHHFTVSHGTRAEDAPRGQTPTKIEGQPFEDCYLLHLGEKLTDPEAEVAALPLADYLLLNAATSLGAAIEQYRRATRTAVGRPGEDSFVRTFLLSRISVPRHRLAALAANQVCKKILQRWHAGPEKSQDPFVEEAVEYFDKVGLDIEPLAGRLYSAVETGMGEDPASYFRNMLEDVNSTQTPTPGHGGREEECRRIWHKIESFFGATRGATDEDEGAADTLALDLMEKQALKVAGDLKGKLLAWLEEAVEDPGRRLPAAEAAGRTILQRLRHAEARAAELLEEGKRSLTQTRGLFANGNFGGRSSGSTWFPIGRRPSDLKGPREAFLNYALDRLRQVLVEEMTTIYAALDNQTSEFLQELAGGRQKLRLLAEDFAARMSSAQVTADAREARPGRIELIPGGAESVSEGAKELLSRFDSETIARLDSEFQKRYLEPHGGLWKMVSAQEELSRELHHALHNHARAAVLESLKGIDAPALFLRVHGGTDEARQALSDVITAVPPRLTANGGWKHLVAAIPPGEAGDTLREILHQAVPNVTSTVVRSEGNIVICQEIGHLSTARVALDLIGDEKGIKEFAPRLMTRTDVDWVPLVNV